MRLKEFQMSTEPVADIIDEADMQRIAAVAQSDDTAWSNPMTAEQAIAMTLQLAGGGNASTDTSM